ncbi:MAG: MurR/RpiR family transcriptional regulator [Micrococcaceae bacterium]|nr:MurR/RpiR family transcriptional regulator [Micrococcaceae bacterium]
MSEIVTWIDSLILQREVSPAIGRVLEVLQDDPGGTFDLSAQKIAVLARVNVASVVRAAQFLGFSGWPAFKQEVRHRYLATLSGDQLMGARNTSGHSPSRSSMMADVKNLHDFVARADEDQFRRIADLIANARRSMVLATGSYAAPGVQLSHIGLTLGHDLELHTAMSTGLAARIRLLREGDCVISCALWRSSTWILEATRVAKKRGANVVVISDRRTDLSDLADESVIVPSEGVSYLMSMTAAMTVSQAVIAELTSRNPESSAESLRDVELIWQELNLVDPAT